MIEILGERVALSSFVVPALVAIFTTWVSTQYKQRNERIARKRAVLCSLYSEVKSLINLIQERLESLNAITDDQKPFVYLPTYQNYFSIYDTNVKDLSVLGSDSLIREIIKTYMETKGLFDDVKGFSENSMEIKKMIAQKDGDITPQTALFLENQRLYFNAIAYHRAPKILRMLDNLKDLLEEHRRQ